MLFVPGLFACCYPCCIVIAFGLMHARIAPRSRGWTNGMMNNLLATAGKLGRGRIAILKILPPLIHHEQDVLRKRGHSFQDKARQ